MQYSTSSGKMEGGYKNNVATRSPRISSGGVISFAVLSFKENTQYC